MRVEQESQQFGLSETKRVTDTTTPAPTITEYQYHSDFWQRELRLELSHVVTSRKVLIAAIHLHSCSTDYNPNIVWLP
jgi:hypothetical protein